MSTQLLHRAVLTLPVLLLPVCLWAAISDMVFFDDW